ncbi:MAG: hypothetical protein FD123_3110 [Bacteroidetes bacterium]|nr:MAG: hypothetical protein FD123_3110 [Bacteroidota bacterium]
MHRAGSFQIVAGAILFGLIPVFVSSCAGLSITSIALGRALFAALFAGSVLLLKGGNLRIRRKELLHYFTWTLFLTGAILCYVLSIRYTGVAVSGALLGIQPVFIILFVRLFFAEKIRTQAMLSCIVAMAGIILVSGIGGSENYSAKGCVFGLLSAVFLGLNFTYHLKFMKHESPLRLVYIQNLLQLPVLLPFVLVNPGTVSFVGIGSVFFMGIFCTSIAYLLIYSGSKKVNKQYIGILQLVENIIPVFIGALVYRESISIAAGWGIALILLSALMAGGRQEKRVSVSN